MTRVFSEEFAEWLKSDSLPEGSFDFSCRIEKDRGQVIIHFLRLVTVSADVPFPLDPYTIRSGPLEKEVKVGS